MVRYFLHNMGSWYVKRCESDLPVVSNMSLVPTFPNHTTLQISKFLVKRHRFRMHCLSFIKIVTCTDHVLLYSARGQQLRNCIPVGIHLNLIRCT